MNIDCNASINSKREHPPHPRQTPEEVFEVVKSPAPGQNFPAKARPPGQRSVCSWKVPSCGINWQLGTLMIDNRSDPRAIQMVQIPGTRAENRCKTPGVARGDVRAWNWLMHNSNIILLCGFPHRVTCPEPSSKAWLIVLTHTYFTGNSGKMVSDDFNSASNRSHNIVNDQTF